MLHMSVANGAVKYGYARVSTNSAQAWRLRQQF